MNPRLPRAAIVCAVSLCAPAVAPAQVFLPMGIPAGTNASNGCAISGDGSVVVGYTGYGPVPWRAFRWTPSGGIEYIEGLPPERNSLAISISRDGERILVHSSTIFEPTRTFLWTRSGGPQELEVPPEAPYSRATYLSADGLVAVGSGSFEDHFHRALRWSIPSGAVEVLPLDDDLEKAWAAGASRDGKWIVGGFLRVPMLEFGAFRWSRAGGMEVLPPFPGHLTPTCDAVAISDDGSVTVGTCSRGKVTQPCRWTAAGVEGLGVPSGLSVAYTMDLSGDGAVVGAYSKQPENRALIWRRDLGMIDLNVYLPLLGVDLTGWVLSATNGLNADGTAITGWGRHNGADEGWVAYLPGHPIACLANCDRSMTPPILTVNDFVCFQSRFAAADPYADCDRNSALTAADFVCFQTQFAAGCP